MTQEDKQLLLKDLCARLPYGLMFQSYHSECGVEGKGTFDFEIGDDVTLSKLKHLCETDNNKPYLRPMSSMTEEEEGMYNLLQGISHLAEQHWTAKDGKVYRYADAIDWLNEHHFDYRGLIPMGLALEAPEGMYEKF